MQNSPNLHRMTRIEQLTADLLNMGRRRRKGDLATAEAIMHELGLLMAMEVIERMDPQQTPEQPSA